MERPIRYLIMDLTHVNGIDFSAAEAFIRMKRLLAAKDVFLVLCGVHANSDVGKGLRSVGMWEEGDGSVRVYEDLNAALEACENFFLSAYYEHKERMLAGVHLQVPNSPKKRLNSLESYASPRLQRLHEAAHTAAQIETVATKWADLRQPLPLLLSTLHGMSDGDEAFWAPLCEYLVVEDRLAGEVLFHRGEHAEAFYFLETGVLKAEYEYEQGHFTETIVAGTTCGELPFFSSTLRTATVIVDRNCKLWKLDEHNWNRLRSDPGKQNIVIELLRIALILTTERVDAITGYVLCSA